ncbi:MAG TPA: hypothetical protein VHG08_19265 [Longimicrobium sp.]|nr:hypothetical protein [Longimicrobium sp.]
MNPPTPQQRIVFQLSMYSNLVANRKGPNLEADLYRAIKDALAANRDQIGNWSVVWGPAVYQYNTTSLAINAMYVAKGEDPDNRDTYVVGIAGTNPSSLFDWIFEDGLVGKQIPWPYALASAPDAKISLGTGIGLVILQNLAPGSGIPGTGTTLRQFLAGIPGKPGKSLVVAGHSLGGALSATVTLWLHDIRPLWDPFRQVTLSSIPTAGPTAGNGAFARYSDGAIQVARFANAIDVVPHAWQASDLAQIPTLYVPFIQPDGTINYLVHVAEGISARGDYTQIAGDSGVFPFDVDRSIIFPHLQPVVNFLLQLAWQHTTAYLRYFAATSPELATWAMEFQTRALAEAPAVAAGLAVEAAAKEVTAPVNGRPAIIPPASDPASDEVAARVLALRISSASAVTETSAESLSVSCQTLPSPGRAKRATCGTRMRRKTSERCMPMALAASISPLGTERTAPRMTSVEYAPETMPTATMPMVKALSSM